MADLHAEIVAGPGGGATRHVVLLHGILGSGANWRSFARGLAMACPAWGVVLVDLRMHGRSQGFAPPHTLAAAADDVRRLVDRLDHGGIAAAAVCGHSFGGKVALTLREARALPTLVLDASPSARPEALLTPEPGSAAAVLALLEELPRSWPRRDEFVAVVMARGFERGLAMWLAQNLEQRGAGLELRLDLGAVRDLLTDYFARDLWPVVAAASAAAPIDFVVGGRSNSVPGGERVRLAALPSVSCQVIAEAGHWLHVDAPAVLLERMLAWLGRVGPAC